MLRNILEESRVYQDAKIDGGIAIVSRQLNRKLGKLSEAIITKIEALSLEQLEELSEALLDFSTVANLEQWLQSRPKPAEQE